LNSSQAATWGEGYLPNIPVVTQNGEKLRFFDDVIKGKIVVISFIYTSCRDICPVVTARLAQVQDKLGDLAGPRHLLRLGQHRSGDGHAGQGLHSWIFGEDLRRSVSLEEQDLIRFMCSSIHARSVERHAGRAESNRVGALHEKAFDLACGNVPFDRITLDRRGVAGSGRFRHAMQFLDRSHVICIVHLHVHARRFQGLRPTMATAALRRAPGRDILRDRAGRR
jgi:hypothetical protein